MKDQIASSIHLSTSLKKQISALATGSDIIHQSSMSIQNSDKYLLPLPLSFLHIFLRSQISVSTF